MSKNKNSLTVIYGLDNENQLSQLEISLRSLKLSNGNDYEVMILVSSKELEEKVSSIFSSINFGVDKKIIIINELTGIWRKGMFYWFLSPYLVETKYILQLDNDIVINSKLSNLLNATPQKEGKISGVRINFSFNNSAVKTLENVFDFKVNEHSMKRWINAGVVLIDVDAVKRVVPTYEEMVKKLEDYLLANKDSKYSRFSVTDEAFLMLNFWDIMSPLNRRYNLRVHSPKSTRKYLKTDNYFFHYNLKVNINDKMEKIDFKKLVLDSDYANNDVMDGVSMYFLEMKSNSKYAKFLISNLRKKHSKLFSEDEINGN